MQTEDNTPTAKIIAYYNNGKQNRLQMFEMPLGHEIETILYAAVEWKVDPKDIEILIIKERVKLGITLTKEPTITTTIN